MFSTILILLQFQATTSFPIGLLQPRVQGSQSEPKSAGDQVEQVGEDLDGHGRIQGSGVNICPKIFSSVLAANPKFLGSSSQPRLNRFSLPSPGPFLMIGEPFDQSKCI